MLKFRACNTAVIRTDLRILLEEKKIMKNNGNKHKNKLKYIFFKYLINEFILLYIYIYIYI